MKISVIIPTYNGAHKLVNLLNALVLQTYQPNEIIVVVDGSSDTTQKVLTTFKRQLANFRFIVQENMGRSSVRNRGAQEAMGDLLIFFDDDMLPQSDCIAQHALHHHEKPRSIMTGAAIDSFRNTDFQQFRSKLSIQWASSLQVNQGNPLSYDSLFLMAANFSMPKSLFWHLGGFDTRLTDAEDFDLAVRAYEAGIALYYNHNAFSYHVDMITGTSYIKRLRQYRAAHERLRLLEPQRYATITIHRPEAIKGIKKLFFKLFAQHFWVKWLDQDALKKFIPMQIRYKLYDYIITANGVYFPTIVSLD